MGERDKGRGLTTLALVLSAMLVLAGAAMLHLVLSSLSDDAAEAPASDRGLEPRSFSEYDWDELAEVAGYIAEAGDAQAATEVAREWGIELGDVRPLALSDGRSALLTVVGIAHDERSDGAGRAGLTLMTSPISLRSVNGDDTVSGGWEQSELRAWLGDDGIALLPEGLAQSVVSVRKSTNNTGKTDDPASVTQTDDALWLFSVREVCGDITLFVDEYGEEIRGRTDYIDYGAYDELLELEGTQYAYFRELGVTCSSGASELAQEYGGGEVSWWYRTPYPYAFNGEEGAYFYQVMATGYPSTLGYASSEAGVVVGLCL